MANRWIGVGVLGVAGLGFWAGCGGGPTEAEKAAAAGILLYHNGAEPKTLDPHLATGVTENRIISALLEGLITYHPTDDSLPYPAMAESWQHNQDMSVWTFQLREDTFWTNGDPVTAHDFVYSFQRMLSPGLAAEYGDMLFIMQNAQAYRSGEIDDFSEVGVKALDDKTLEITLKGPTSYFLSMLKHYSWYPVHPPTVEKFGGMTARASDWIDPENFVGNGPFTLKTWETNRVIEVAKNPNYWDAENVALNGIRFLPIDQAATALQTYLAGGLHYLQTLPPEQIEPMRQRHPEQLRLDPYLGTYFYRFNTTRPPLDDPKVREALALAVNREEIVQFVTKGDQRPAYGYTPDGMKGYETPQPLEHNPERARELLAEAGYPGGEGFPTKSILINTSEAHRRIAEAIQEMWRTELGIDVDIENMEWKVYLDAQSNLNYDISRSGWIGDFMDPITFLGMWTTGNGNNDTGWSNARYDELIRKAQAASNEREHYDYLLEAENILLEELPMIPLYWYTSIYMLHPLVGGWEPKLLDNRPYKALYFKETVAE